MTLSKGRVKTPPVLLVAERLLQSLCLSGPPAVLLLLADPVG